MSVESGTRKAGTGTDLVAFAMDAQGGLDRWRTFKSVSAHLMQGGALWKLKGHEDTLKEVNVTVPRVPNGPSIRHSVARISIRPSLPTASPLNRAMATSFTSVSIRAIPSRATRWRRPGTICSWHTSPDTQCGPT